MQNETYYISFMGITTGPFTSVQLIQLFQAGQIGKYHLVSTDCKNWNNIQSLKWFINAIENPTLLNLEQIVTPAISTPPSLTNSVDHPGLHQVETSIKTTALQPNQQDNKYVVARKLTVICKYCGERVIPSAIKCKHCGEIINEHLYKQETSSGCALALGVFLLILGLLVTFLYFNKDTSVSSWDGRVHNVGLMNEKICGLIVGIAISGGGLAIILFVRRKR